MSVNFNPVLGEYKATGSFKFWCQKVLPCVYDDSLSYYELLCKVVNTLNDVIQNVDTINENTNKLATAYQQLENYVNTYFDNLNVQNEIDNKLDEMAESGALAEVVTAYIAGTTDITKRRFVLIGDSYASAGYFTTKSWRNYLIEYLGLTEGIDVFSNWMGSTGFVATSDDGTNFISLVHYVNVTVDDGLITDIVVIGGYNDYPYDRGVIQSGISNFKRIANKRFPNAKIWLGMAGWSMDEPAITGCRDLWNKWQVICPPLGICLLADVYPALHLYLDETPVFNTEISGGRFHPNEYGSQMIAEAAFENIMGCRWNNDIGNRAASISDENGWSISDNSIITDSKQGFKRLWFYRTRLFKNAGVTMQYESATPIGKLSNTTLLPDNTVSINTVGKFNIANVGTTYKPITLLLDTSGVLSIRINEVGTSFDNYTIIDIYDALLILNKFVT